MEIGLYIALLCMVKSSFVQASPISEADVAVNRNLPTSKGYIPTPGIGTHKYHGIQKKNWNDARTTCLNEGGHLVVINSAAEEALLAKYINTSAGINQIWTGVHELFKKDEWVSVKDQRLDAIGYVHWAYGQPDSTPNEHCGTLYDDGIHGHGLNDFVCEQELFFVCEI